jgi:hypothetical protein
MIIMAGAIILTMGIILRIILRFRRRS